MSRNLFRLTLGLAALGFVLVGLESQADAFGRRGGRHHGCRSSCHSHHKSCEPVCEEPKDCGGCEAAPCKEEKSCACEEEVKDCGGCKSDCGGCDSGCGKKRCGHKHRRHRGCGRDKGCDSGCNGGCGDNGGCGGCEGGEVIHEEKAVEKTDSAPAPPAEEAPSA